jgi:hypothetical protein
MLPSIGRILLIITLSAYAIVPSLVRTKFVRGYDGKTEGEGTKYAMESPSSPPDRVVKRRNKKGSACTYCRQLKVRGISQHHVELSINSLL